MLQGRHAPGRGHQRQRRDRTRPRRSWTRAEATAATATHPARSTLAGFRRLSDATPPDRDGTLVPTTRGADKVGCDAVPVRRQTWGVEHELGRAYAWPRPRAPRPARRRSRSAQIGASGALSAGAHRHDGLNLLKLGRYMLEENRVLREQLGDRRLRFTDKQRRRLARKGEKVGRVELEQTATVARPDTILGWCRRLIARIRREQASA